MTTILSTKTAGTKFINAVDERCKICFLNTYQRLFKKFNVGINSRKDFIDFYQNTIINCKHLSSPEIQRELNKKFCQIIKVNDPYKEEKASSNNIAIKICRKWKPKVLSSANPFDLALRLSIAGNIMDYGAHDSFDILDTINNVINTPFAINHSELLKKRIQKANRILYLGDNAGEIVFDKLFIEIIMHHNIVFAVKESPVLNDVTIADAKRAGMDLVSDVISNGFDAPSTILEKCSKEFIDIYNSSDLIISKGQGNLEGLINEKDSRIFFLLMVKCDVIAEILNVKKGSFIVYNQKIDN